MKLDIVDYVEKSFSRELVSFGGVCPVACNHCYTFMQGYQRKSDEDVDKIVASLQGKQLDIIYISGHCENFIDSSKGTTLCEKLFHAYRCDIMFTTRMIFPDVIISRLSKLNERMRREGKFLYACSSIPAQESYGKLEPSPLIPSPEERMYFLSKMRNEGITTFLTIRPVFPDNYIPTVELINIVDNAKDYSDVVLASGVVVNDDVLKRLSGFVPQKTFSKKLMDCLGENIDAQYVDVDCELKKIGERCALHRVPFFNSSLVAVKFLKIVSQITDKEKKYQLYEKYMSALNRNQVAINDFYTEADNDRDRVFWDGLRK